MSICSSTSSGFPMFKWIFKICLPFRLAVLKMINSQKQLSFVHLFECVWYVAEQIQGCKLDDGEIINYGEEFKKNGDPCTTCTCMEGSILRCKSVGCVMPPGRSTCPSGHVYRMSTETCCEFGCFPTEDPEEGKHLPYMYRFESLLLTVGWRLLCVETVLFLVVSYHVTKF